MEQLANPIEQGERFDPPPQLSVDRSEFRVR